MKNRDHNATWSYHDGTKHSYQSIRANPHYLDWDNQPLPFKIYSTLEAIPLPRHLSSPGALALSAIATTAGRSGSATGPGIETLAEIFFLSAGITRRKRHPGGEVLFRAAACTGALYHIDLYLVCGDLPGLEAGVYHYGPHDFALRRLRRGDYRGAVVSATAGEPAVAGARAIVISASTYWRNAWKYQSRSYRHCFWDNGTILANMLAGAAARDIPAKLVVGFVDSSVNRLLGLDPAREAALTVVALGNVRAMAPGVAAEIGSLSFETVPLSKREVDYPAIRAVHEASSLESEEEVTAWRRVKDEGGRPALSSAEGMKDEGTGVKNEGRLFPLVPLAENEMPQDTIEDVVMRRGSTRRFAREPISLGQLSTMLERVTREVPADFSESAGGPLNDLYLIVHAVDGLPPGAYLFRRDSRALELLKEGDFRERAGYLGLGQEIPADCSVDIFFLVDLKPILERFGNRGYRVAQLEAAITGGKLYLAAHAQRLGASGLTFFDDDVTEFFSPRAAGKSVMFLIALGRSVKAKRIG